MDEEKKSTVKKFNPQKEILKAEKEQPNSGYAIEFVLSAEDAEAFEYLSHWEGRQYVYRVVARLNMDDGIKVQLIRVPNMAPKHA